MSGGNWQARRQFRRWPTGQDAILHDTIDMLVATDTARLSRDSEDLADLVHWMSHHDVRIHLVGHDALQIPESCPR